jgi:hypothetical protein
MGCKQMHWRAVRISKISNTNMMFSRLIRLQRYRGYALSQFNRHDWKQIIMITIIIIIII